MGNLVLFLKKILNRFVPGRTGTEEFVPGHLLLPLSRDNGTPEQEIFFVPGQRDVPSRFVPGRPVPWKHYSKLMM